MTFLRKAFFPRATSAHFDELTKLMPTMDSR